MNLSYYSVDHVGDKIVHGLYRKPAILTRGWLNNNEGKAGVYNKTLVMALGRYNTHMEKLSFSSFLKAHFGTLDDH